MTKKKHGCTAKTSAGVPCKAPVKPGEDRCRWHPTDPEGRARHREESRKGGLTKAYGSLPSGSPLADAPDVAVLNLESAEGLTTFLAKALHALARLPFDTRTANAIGQLATAQRSMIEGSDFAKRLAALERASGTPFQNVAALQGRSSPFVQRLK